MCGRLAALQIGTTTQLNTHTAQNDWLLSFFIAFAPFMLSRSTMQLFPLNIYCYHLYSKQCDNILLCCFGWHFVELNENLINVDSFICEINCIPNKDFQGLLLGMCTLKLKILLHPNANGFNSHFPWNFIQHAGAIGIESTQILISINFVQLEHDNFCSIALQQLTNHLKLLFQI